MTNTLATRLALLASAFVGGILCILADLVQKSEASAVLLIGQTLGEVIGIRSPTLVAIAIILIIAASLPLIFESTSKRAAFYAGASVLAIVMTITPYNPPPGLETNPSSVQVSLSVSTQDGTPVKGATVTVSPVEAPAQTPTARSRMRGSTLTFFLEGGTYRLIVELPGYAAYTHTLSLIEGASPQSLAITLQPSSTPLFIQRILR